MAKAKNKEVKVDLTFKDESTGGVYKHTGQSIRHNGKVYSAEEAMKNPEVLAYLVSVKSKVLEVVEEGEEVAREAFGNESVDVRIGRLEAKIDTIHEILSEAFLKEPAPEPASEQKEPSGKVTDEQKEPSGKVTEEKKGKEAK